MLKNQSLLKRLIISEIDLWQAKEFAEYILEKELHDKQDKEARLVHLAFNTALIVSYSRPLGTNKSKTDQVKPSLPRHFVEEVLNEDEKGSIR